MAADFILWNILNNIEEHCRVPIFYGFHDSVSCVITTQARFENLW